jgi:hypothetical protein
VVVKKEISLAAETASLKGAPMVESMVQMRVKLMAANLALW